ncbi:type II and III secretion system protein [bacterium]|nr:type II and III secretion system protein [bacterium]
MKRAISILTFIILLSAVWCAAEVDVGKQGNKHLFVPNKYPIEHTSSDELVSLSADTSFSQAMFILSKFSNKFEKKVIIDPEKHKGTVGVDIENMHWKKAFEMVLRANGLWYASFDTYYEIAEPVAQEVSTSKTPKRSKTPVGKKVSLTENTREVRIKATFFEADRRLLREIGIDWTTLRNGSLLLGGSNIGASKVGEEMLSVLLSKTFHDGRAQVDVLLRTIENAEKGRIISSPQIVAMVGKPAKILVGQEFAVNTRDFAGNVVTDFYETGTIMQVTPTVFKGRDDEEYIHLGISVERSSLVDPVNITINKTQARSSVLLYDGEDTAIAGLYSTDRNTQRKGVPFLKDLPWWVLGLRYVFGFDRVEKKDKELIILLKAELLDKLPARLAARGTQPSVFDATEKELQTTVKKHWDGPGEADED